MKKILIISGISAAIIAIFVIAIVGIIERKNNDSNDRAEKNQNGRYLTIINDTKQIINEVHVFVGEGTEIESMMRTNIDKTSLSLEIPEEYSEYTSFIVILVDRYDIKYQKEVNNVTKKGRTEVKITEKDYIEEKGDFWDKINKFFNGD